MMNKTVLPTVVTTYDKNVPSKILCPAESIHRRSPSDPTFLSPQNTPSSVPPSSTLSNASGVHWQDSRSLRQNEVDGGLTGGMSSLLEPGHTKHGMKASVTCYTSMVPGEKHSVLSSTLTGMTAAATLLSGKKKSKQSRDDAGDATTNYPDSSQDQIDPTPFKQRLLILASLVGLKSLATLEAIGGTEGLLRDLGTDTKLGLRTWQDSDSNQRSDPESGNDGGAGAGGDSPVTCAKVEDTKRVYGISQSSSRKSERLLLLMRLALQDKVLLLLFISALVSLALGLNADFRTGYKLIPCDGDIKATCEAPEVDWVEGTAIMIAILLIVIVGSLNDWQNERQFRRLNYKKENHGVKVIRDGKERLINVKDVLVGDIVLLQPGEMIPCDGVFLRGHNVRCDESGATGDSDTIKKVTFEEYQEEVKSLKSGEKLKLSCFIVSGSKVLEGDGQYVVIAVGPRAFHGRIMATLPGNTRSTLLQLKLNALAEFIAKLGSAAGLILFSALVIKFFVHFKAKSERSTNEKAASLVQFLIISVTAPIGKLKEESVPRKVVRDLVVAPTKQHQNHMQSLASTQEPDHPSYRSTPSTVLEPGKRVSNRLSLHNSNNRPSEITDTITSIMQTGEVVQHLVKHGCPEITKDLDLDSCSSSPIAWGGFSDVYSGKLYDGTEVVIKCPRTLQNLGRSDGSSKVLKHTAQEVYTWAKCDHPGILRLRGIARFQDQVAMVSEWMPNGSLTDYLRKQPSIDRIQLCVQLSEALEYMHGKRIVHGDIKPANVLMSNNNTPLFTDFGSALLEYEASLQFTPTTTLETTLRYMAPELLDSDNNKHSFETDIYAFGMEIMTGQVPFPDKRSVAVCLAAARGEVPKRPDLSSILPQKRLEDELWGLLTCCWAIEANSRPSAPQLRETVSKLLSIPGFQADA
ncbi:hypothetical protein FRC09_014350 [Ceratobasidium sp. 395]|nr:hypothetical protein FRC09_014350 [Ceratobasidium sp. 395]